MSFFGNPNFANINKKLQEVQSAINNANQKVTDLDNYNFELVTMGNYKIDHNESDDTLDFTYEKL